MLSSLVVARVVPSGDHATAFTQPVCLVRIWVVGHDSRWFVNTHIVLVTGLMAPVSPSTTRCATGPAPLNLRYRYRRLRQVSASC